LPPCRRTSEGAIAQISSRERFIAGLFAAGMGVITILLIVFDPEELRVPFWVAFAAASTFVTGGAALISGAFSATKLEGWFGVLAVLGLLVPAAWIAFGPGDHVCTVTLPFLSTAGAEWLCRGAFGLGALLVLAVLILFGRRVTRL
jgi:hypothetical protein